MAPESKALAAARPQFGVIAAELEAALPSGVDLEKGKQSSFGGVITKGLALLAALRTGDPKQIWDAFLALLNEFATPATPPTGGDGSISFAMQAAGLKGFDWLKIMEVLKKIFPLIIGLI